MTRVRGRFFCLLGVLGAVASGGVATAAPAPSCTFPARQTVALRPAGGDAPAEVDRRAKLGATVCERATGAQGMEPMLAVNGRGTMFMGIATDHGLYEQPGELTGTAENALLRSRNDGRTWRRIPLPGGINASEGFPYVDPLTDRLFVTSLSADADPLRPAGHLQRRRGRALDRGRRPAGLLAADRRRLAEDLRRPAPGRAPQGALPERRLPVQLRPQRPRRRVDRLLALGRRGRPLRVRELPPDGQRRLHRRR